MASINTNLSAMTALQSLKSTQSSLNKTQSQISTGLRVGSASDNASYWSIATQMKSDNGALSAVKDSISQSKAMIDTFTSAMDKSLTYLNKMKAGLVAATQPGADLAKIQTEFTADIEGMKSAAGSASFNGQNWLAQGTPGTVNLVTSYDGNTNTVGTLAIDTSKTNLFTDASAGTGGLLGDVAAINITDDFSPTTVTSSAASGGTAADAVLTGTDTLSLEAGAKISVSQNGGTATSYTVQDGDTWSDVATALSGTYDSTANTLTFSSGTTDGDTVAVNFAPAGVAGALAKVDEAISNVTEGSSMLGANKALLETQEEFIGTLSDSLTAGVSAFVDADMNEASTRLQALQTQQQLGVQALSIANQNSQMILRLFQ